MQGISFVGVFDPKVVNNKGEEDWASLMEIQARSILGREVPSSGKDLFKLLVGHFTSLLEAVHGDCNVDETVGGNFGGKVVVLDDVGRESGIGDTHVNKLV